MGHPFVTVTYFCSRWFIILFAVFYRDKTSDVNRTILEIRSPSNMAKDKHRTFILKTASLCPVYGFRKRDSNGNLTQKVRSYRIWCLWEDGEWTAETVKIRVPYVDYRAVLTIILRIEYMEH